MGGVRNPEFGMIMTMNNDYDEDGGAEMGPSTLQKGFLQDIGHFES